MGPSCEIGTSELEVSRKPCAKVGARLHILEMVALHIGHPESNSIQEVGMRSSSSQHVVLAAIRSLEAAMTSL